MNKSPSWLGFEVLPGGFVTEIPLAGGELLDWEIEAFRAGGVESRRELNQFYLSERGRQILLENLKRGSYRLSQPEEAALLSIVWSQDLTVSKILEPLMDNVRFYPQLLTCPCPEALFGIVSLYTCRDALEALRAYKLPLDVRRERETLTLWRPFQERMLSVVSETSVDDWPFQHYPPDWKVRAKALVSEVETALAKDVACHFCQRSDSDFRRLLASVRTAALDPSKLSGRDVAFCRTVLLQKSGLASESSDAPGQAVLNALVQLIPQLDLLPPERGLDPSAPFLVGLPKALKKRVLRSRQGTLQQLYDWNILTSAEILGQLAPKLVSGVFTGAQSTLLARCYRAFSNGPRQISFEKLPWIAPLWSPPPKEKVESAVRQILECWWNRFPQFALSAKLQSELQNLARWLELPQPDAPDTLLNSLVRATHPKIDLAQAVRRCQDELVRQRSLSCPKPYQQLRRDKVIERCQRQMEFLEELFLTRKRP